MRNQIEILLWPTDLPAGAQTIPTSQIEKLRDEETNEYLTFVGQPTLTVYFAPEDRRSENNL